MRSPAEVTRAVNQWLFNEDTVDKVLEHLMERGQKVADGDRLGKTIIFAKNHAHAEFIVERFDANYPHLKGTFARVIDFKVTYAQSSDRRFFQAREGAAHRHLGGHAGYRHRHSGDCESGILQDGAVENEVLADGGTGNAIAARPIRPGADKKFFYIFDYCQNLEFFSQNPETTDGAAGESLGKKLFSSRVELIAEIDKIRARQAAGDLDGTEKLLRADIAELLRIEVAGMNVDNFIVRPRRRLVERYAEAEAWEEIDIEKIGELTRDVAGLPSSVVDEDQEAKQFDLLMLRLQLTLLRAERGLERCGTSVQHRETVGRKSGYPHGGEPACADPGSADGCVLGRCGRFGTGRGPAEAAPW